MLDLKFRAVGEPRIVHLPALSSHLKLKSVTLPRDNLLKSQLRAQAAQILKSKDIDPTRIDDAIAGSITMAMIPMDDEVATVDLEQSSPVKYRQGLMSGEYDLNTRSMWVALLSAFVMIFLLLITVEWAGALKLLTRLLVTISGRWFKYSIQTWIFRGFMGIMAALATRLLAW